MKTKITSIGLCLFIVSLYACYEMRNAPADHESGDEHYAYDDNYLSIRNYPEAMPNLAAYQKAMKSTHQQLNNPQSRSNVGFDSMWDMEGAGNIGGRINAIAISPFNSNHILVGAARGGVFRSTDNGNTWQSIFDAQPALSIGSIATHPTDPSTIYVGTGDRNISIYPGIGTGIYRSTNGGNTWQNMGLEETYIISKIVINPQNPNQIFAATMGLPFVRDNNRGVYRSNDGGETWEQVLFVSNQAGAIDMVINPNNPTTIYASFWDRIRNNQETTIEGEHGGVWRSTDGGTTWEELTNGLPADEVMGRVNIAISKSNPNILYAALVAPYTADLYGVFRSQDGGDSWQQTAASGAEDITGGQGWYYTDIAVNPTNDAQVFLLGLYILRSEDSAETFQQTWEGDPVHPDMHAIAFAPNGNVLIGTDGGAYYSTDSGQSWYDLENIPISQFYRTAYNPHYPNLYFGGTQDNGTCRGSGDDPNNWVQYWGSDGFQPLFHPTNPDIFYVETQNGDIYRTTDGGESFDWSVAGIVPEDRRSWDMQYIMSQHNPDVLYTGTYRMYKSTNGGETWDTISPDLSDGLVYAARFHTITTLAESPINANLLYAGTVDANVWRTTNGGETWDSIHHNGLPNRYISCLRASSNDANTIFVSLSGYKSNDFVAHIYKSTNKGNTWQNIGGDMPTIAVNDLYVMPQSDLIIFAATDAGVYGTIDGGTHWERLGEGMPMVPVYDLDYNPVSQQLIAATFARSIMTYPLNTIINDFTAVPTANAATLALQIMPNPVQDRLQIQLPTTNTQQLQLFDTKGTIVHSQNIQNTRQTTLSLQQLPTGIYFLRTVDTTTGQYGIVRIAKQ
ncbi:MAG: T9SS type A sorting domain-containing protein [Chitinophagales bacterium]|nr:T9SS type A sorting domain-containing protein [Chitinophagales bacterium]